VLVRVVLLRVRENELNILGEVEGREVVSAEKVFFDALEVHGRVNLLVVVRYFHNVHRLTEGMGISTVPHFVEKLLAALLPGFLARVLTRTPSSSASLHLQHTK